MKIYKLKKEQLEELVERQKLKNELSQRLNEYREAVKNKKVFNEYVKIVIDENQEYDNNQKEYLKNKFIK